MGRISKVVQLELQELISNYYGMGMGAWSIAKKLKEKHGININYIYVERYLKTRLNPLLRKEKEKEVLEHFKDSEKQLEGLISYSLEILKKIGKSSKPRLIIPLLVEMREQLTLKARMENRIKK